jgi:hypothetical protein
MHKTKKMTVEEEVNEMFKRWQEGKPPRTKFEEYWRKEMIKQSEKLRKKYLGS